MMDKSELEAMHSSFQILDKRRARLLEDESTKKLEEKVQRIREDSLKRLPELLELACENLEDHGVQVIRAKDYREAQKAIYDIVKNESWVAKSKSNTAGEICLTEYLEAKNINVLETDLGDRIVQLHAHSQPSHPIGPAAHLNMKMIAQILEGEFNISIEPQPRPILEVIKADVLDKLVKCRVGITGANSVAAEDGSLLMVHNEGNISLVSMLDTHIILVGIDKLVSTIEDAISVVKLETIYATGKTVPAYMNIISSPSKTADIEQILLDDMYGPRRVVVILLDNGRLKALKDDPDCLLCIGCGSCIVNCPIYHALGPEYGYKRHLGGRGVVLSRFIQDKKTCYDSGLFKCTLCGLCTIECPLDISTNKLVEKLRIELTDSYMFPEPHAKIVDNIKKRGSPFNTH